MKKRAEVPWLQGGPFLEVSFLLENNKSRRDFLILFFEKLRDLSVKFQIKTDRLDKQIDDFSKEYPYDENDPQRFQIHSIKIPLMIDVAGERKSMLHIDEVAENTVLFDFCFFGDKEDILEWDQKGIKDGEMPEFSNFLISLYHIFKFPFGLIGLEMDCLFAFGCGKEWPNYCYKVKNLNVKHLLTTLLDNYFLVVLFHKSLYNQKIPYPTRQISGNGILIDTSKNKKTER